VVSLLSCALLIGIEVLTLWCRSGGSAAICTTKQSFQVRSAVGLCIGLLYQILRCRPSILIDSSHLDSFDHILNLASVGKRVSDIHNKHIGTSEE
jgi:hypothetical protein